MKRFSPVRLAGLRAVLATWRRMQDDLPDFDDDTD
jgi:hypothetical protein